MVGFYEMFAWLIEMQPASQYYLTIRYDTLEIILGRFYIPKFIIFLTNGCF